MLSQGRGSEDDVRGRLLAPAGFEGRVDVEVRHGLGGRGAARACVFGVAAGVGAVDVHPRLPGAPRHAALEHHAVGIEAVDVLDGIAYLAQRDTLAEVNFQHADEDVVDFGRDGEDGGEEAHRVAQVRLEGGVPWRRRLPGIAARGEVEKDDPQGPYVVRHRRVFSIDREFAALTF